MMRNIGLALGAFALVTSCGLDLMSDHIVQYDQHMVSTRAEVSSHATTVVGAAAAGVAAAEEAHLTRMLGHMGDMRGGVRRIMSCGSMNDASMMGAMDDLERECRAHRSAMTAAVGDEALRAEEGRHQQTVGDMMDRMRAHSQSMMSASGGMGCGH